MRYKHPKMDLDDIIKLLPLYIEGDLPLFGCVGDTLDRLSWILYTNEDNQ